VKLVIDTDIGTDVDDALAAAVHIQPDLVRTCPLAADVDLGGDAAGGATIPRRPAEDGPPPVRVAPGVDAPRFEQLLLSRLATAPVPAA